MAGSIIEDWLRSLNLVNYTLAFLDNGYDDLEICKQIGEADLDAIGVFKAPHRKEILRAVQNLREEGGTAVYFTLENPDYDDDGNTQVDSFDGDDRIRPNVRASCHLKCSGNYQNADEVVAPEPACEPLRLDEYELGKIALLSFPKLQLRMILRDKLVEDGINLAEPPYTLAENLCGPGMEALCHQYAAELKTFVKDVREALEEHRQVRINIDTSPDKEQSPHGSPTRNIYNLFSIYGQSTRSVPPPLPSCPPPSYSYADPVEVELQTKRSVSLPGSPRSMGRSHLTIFSTERSETTETDVNSQKKLSGLGKFFKNVGIRRSGRKYTYKIHEGDLLASEITMSEEDRISLMLLVKEGKLSMEEAVEKVKQYESEKKSSSQQSTPDQSVSSQPSTPDHQSVGSHQSTPDLSGKMKQVIPRRRKTSEDLMKSGSTKDVSKNRRSAEYTEPPVEFTPEDEIGVGFANHYFMDGVLASSPSPGLSSSPGVFRYAADSSPLRLASSPGQSSPLHFPSRKNSLSSGSSIHSPMEKRRSSGGSSPSVHSPRHGRTGSLSSSSSTRSSPQHQPSPQQQPRPGAQQLPRPVQTRPPLSPSMFSSPEHKIVMGTSVHGSPSHRTGVGIMMPVNTQQYPHTGDVEYDWGRSDFKKDASSGRRYSPSRQAQPAYSHVGTPSSFSAKTSVHSPFEKRCSLHVVMSEPTVRQTGSSTQLHHHHHERQISSDTSSDRLKEIDSEDEKHLVKSQSISCDKYGGSRSQVSSKQATSHTHSCHSQVSTTTITKTVTVVTDSSPEHYSVHNFTPGSDSEPSGGLELYISSSQCVGHSSPMVGMATDSFHHASQKVMVNGVINRIKPCTWQRSGSYSTEDGLSSDADDTDVNTQKVDKNCDNQELQVNLVRTNGQDKTPEVKVSVAQDKAFIHQKEETSHSPSHDARLGSSLESMHSASSVATSSSGARSSVDDESVYTGPFIGIACVHTECQPATGDQDLLTTKKGDIIHIIKRSESGFWKGLLNNKIGMFKLSHVDLLSEESCRQIRQRQRQAKRRNSRRSKPKTVEELLHRLGLQHLLSVFLVNGYGKLETFRDLDPDDLTDLNITNGEERAKILTAVELLQDYDSMGCESPEPNKRSTPVDGSTGVSSQSPNTVSSCDSPRLINTGTTGSRDSGCYASHENLVNKMPKSDDKERLESHLANGVKKMEVKESSLQKSSAFQSKIIQKPSEVSSRDIPEDICEQKSPRVEKGSTTANDREMTQEDEEVISITIGQEKTGEKTKQVTVFSGKQLSIHLQQNGQVVSGTGSRLPLAKYSRTSQNVVTSDHSSKSKQKKAPTKTASSEKLHSGDNAGDKVLTEGTSPKIQYVPKPLPQAVGKISLSPKHGLSSRGIRRPPPVPVRNSTRTIHMTRQASIEGQNTSSSSSSPPPPGVAASGNPNVEKMKHNHVRTRSLPENIFPKSSSQSLINKEKTCSSGEGAAHSKHQRRSSRSLETMVLAQLEKDGIDLTRPAQSEKTSIATLVPWLVQRYAGLLQRDSQEIALALEHARSKQVRKLKMLTAEQKTEDRSQDSLMTPQRSGSLSEFLHTAGLPVYTDCFLRHGYHTVDSVKDMKEPDLKRCGVHDPKHIKKLLRAVESLRSHNTAETSGGTSRSSKLSGVKDKV